MGADSLKTGRRSKSAFRAVSLLPVRNRTFTYVNSSRSLWALLPPKRSNSDAAVSSSSRALFQLLSDIAFQALATAGTISPAKPLFQSISLLR